jgi:hypothetical protein
MATSITDLCQKLKDRSSGKTNEELILLIKELCGSHIIVRYEILNKDAESNNSHTAQNTSKYAYLNNVKIYRILLTTHRLNGKFENDLEKQCNGLILEFLTWKVLSVPSKMLKPNYKVNELKNNLSQYSIYEIKDGTTVTIYSVLSELGDYIWCISSANGYDVSDYQLLGSTTYFEAIMEVGKLYPEFSLDKLDPSRCYTIGFRHSDFQPLLSDRNNMWLIQSCDLNLLNNENKFVLSTPDIGLPVQQPLNVPLTMEFLLEKNANAMNEYVKNKTIHYGYILRGPTDECMESELLKNIRGYVYNVPKKRLGKSPITPEHRAEYLVLRAYLSNTTKFAFITLFPQYESLYKKFDNIFNKLTVKVISCLRGNMRKQNNTFDSLVIGLADHVRTCGINPSLSESHNIIQDFILSKDNLDLYYECIIFAKSTKY